MDLLPFFIPFYMFLSSSSTPLLWRDRYQGANQMLSLHSEAMLQSAHIHTAGMYPMLQGGNIYNDLKNSMLTSEPGQRLGGDWHSQLRFTQWNDTSLGKQGWGFTVAFSNRLIAEARYHGNVFNLLAEGNAPYAGQTLALGDATARAYMYQQIEAGMVKSWRSEVSASSLSFSLGFVNANWFRGLDAPAGSLYTDSLGRYVDFSADSWTFQSTDPDENGFFFPNGTGFSASLQYEWHWKKRHMIAMAANDLGFIHWNQQSRASQLHGDIRWEGFVIPNLTGIPDQFFEDYADSLKNEYLLEEAEGSFQTVLPMQFSLAYGFAPPKLPLQWIGQIRWRPWSPWLPLSTITTLWRPDKGPFRLAGSIGYGGFGTFQVGLDLGLDFGKGYTIQLRTGNLEGLVPNRFGTGLSAGFTFIKYFLP